MGYNPVPRSMPTPVKAARLILCIAAGLAVLLLAALAIAGFSAREMGTVAMAPLLFGAAGVVLAVLIRPGRWAVRIGIILVAGAWAVVSLGTIGRGDVSGIASMAVSIAVLALVNTRPARAYFRPDSHGTHP